MAITFSTPLSSTFASGGVTLTQSYTVPSGADELWLFGYVDNANVTVPLPDIMAYGGVSATLVAQIPPDAGGTGQLHFFYRILNPVVGTTNITARHPTLSIAINAVCLSVDQNYIMTYSAFNYANSTNPTVTITSASGDKTLFSLTVNNVDTTAVSETGGQTVLTEGGSSIAAMHQLSSETSAGSSNGATWIVSGAQRWSAIAINVHEIAQSIDTLTSPLVPNAAFSGTCTGYADGAAVLSFSGVSADVTITAGTFSGTLPMLSDGVLWPRLPATSQTVTLTQGADVSTIPRDISLPSGYDTIRDSSGNPANFAGLFSGENTYLQPEFIAAGNPLTTNDTGYFTTSGSYKVRQDSGVEADTSSLPRTDTLLIQRAGGVVYEHLVTLNSAGEVVEVVQSNVTLQAGRVEAREQLAVVRVKLAHQANSVAATVADLRTDFNSLISKMNTRGWFTGGEVQTTMLKIAMQNGLIQFLNRIKTQAPDQMDVQSASVAADVAALRTDFNALLTKLKAANLMATS